MPIQHGGDVERPAKIRSTLKNVSVCAVNGCENEKHMANDEISFHRFPSTEQRAIKWAVFCQNPEFAGANVKEILGKISKHRYVICSEHFDPCDIKVEGQRRRVDSSAVPVLFGPLVNDTLGNGISPIQQPKSKALSRLVGLIGSRSSCDSDCDFENQDWDEFSAEVEKRFEGRVESDTPLTLNFRETHNNSRSQTPEPVNEPSQDDSSGQGGGVTASNQKGRSTNKQKTTADMGAFDKDTIYTKLFNNERLPRGERKSYHTYKIHRQNKLLRIANQKLKNGQVTRKDEQKTCLDYIKSVMNPVQSAFLCSVVTNATRKARGRRYNKETKMVCLSLYLFDPRAYGNLRNILQALPSKLTLQRMLENNPVEEGFLPFVFEALKFASAQFDEQSRYVTLSWDAMNLKPELHYVRKQEEGEENGHIGGLDSASHEPATEALVLMIRSIYGDFKQPLAFFNFDPHMAAEKLEPIINTAIEELQKTGLIVKALVCDQASEHQALFTGIFKVTPEKPYIERPVNSGCKIYCMFDPPHLLKSAKANLKGKVAEVAGGGIASWQHVIDFYEYDIAQSSPVAPKLTHDHIYGPSVTNMSVPKAAQVLSRTVAGGIRDLVAQKELDEDALITAEYLEMFNDTFDTLSSGVPKYYRQKHGFPEEGIRDWVPPDPDQKPNTRCPYREPLTATSLHLEMWAKAEEYIKKIKFFRSNTGTLATLPFIKGWLLTISAVRMMWAEFQEMGFTTMPTYTLNQDFIENFFSQVRYRNGHADVSCKEFRNVFKLLVHQYVLDPCKGKNTNCSVDGGRFLLAIQNVVYSKLVPPKATAEKHQSKKSPELQEQLEDVDDPAAPSEEEYILEKNTGDVKYSSYLARRIILQNKECTLCRDIYSCKVREPQHRILDHTENKSSSYKLFASTGKMQVLVHNCLETFNVVLKDNYWRKNLCQLLCTALKNCDGFSLLQECALHQENPKFFIGVFLKSLIKFRIKRENSQLSVYLKTNRARAKVASLASSSAKRRKLFEEDEPIPTAISKPNNESQREKSKISAHILESRDAFFKATEKLVNARKKGDDTSMVPRGLFGAKKKQAVPQVACEIELEDCDDEGFAPLLQDDVSFVADSQVAPCPDTQVQQVTSFSKPQSSKRPLEEDDQEFAHPALMYSTPKKKTPLGGTKGAPSSVRCNASLSNDDGIGLSFDAMTSKNFTPRPRTSSLSSPRVPSIIRHSPMYARQPSSHSINFGLSPITPVAGTSAQGRPRAASVSSKQGVVGVHRAPFYTKDAVTSNYSRLTSMPQMVSSDSSILKLVPTPRSRSASVSVGNIVLEQNGTNTAPYPLSLPKIRPRLRSNPVVTGEIVRRSSITSRNSIDGLAKLVGLAGVPLESSSDVTCVNTASDAH